MSRSNLGAQAGAQVRLALAHAQLMLQRLDGETAHLPWLSVIQARTGVPRVYAFLILAASAFGLMFLGFGLPFFSHLIGFLYPAFASFKAIEARPAVPAAASTREELQWLMYWVVFSIFSLIETFSDVVLFWLPFYYALKVAFLLYCQMPMFRGAEFLYSSFVRPVFLRNQPAIDLQFERLHGASNVLRNVIGFDPLARDGEASSASGGGAPGGTASGMPGGLADSGVAGGSGGEEGGDGVPIGIFGSGPPADSSSTVGGKRRD